MGSGHQHVLLYRTESHCVVYIGCCTTYRYYSSSTSNACYNCSFANPPICQSVSMTTLHPGNMRTISVLPAGLAVTSTGNVLLISPLISALILRWEFTHLFYRCTSKVHTVPTLRLHGLVRRKMNGSRPLGLLQVDLFYKTAS